MVTVTDLSLLDEAEELIDTTHRARSSLMRLVEPTIWLISLKLAELLHQLVLSLIYLSEIHQY